MLSNRDLATVTNKLQVPLIVSDILAGEGELTDDIHFGIHDAISDLQPDSALLCIALSARKMSANYCDQSPAMKMLYQQTGQIIEDYAPLWLQNAQGGDIDESETLDVLSNISEDLEGIAELLELNADFLREQNKSAAQLCDILNIQATAHILVAEAFFEAVNFETEETPEIVITKESTNNIIQFPGSKG